MSGDRTVKARCVGAEPKQYQGINGWALLFDSDELEGGHASKVFWMSPDMKDKTRKYWTEVLTFLGFDPVGKTAEQWSRLGSYIDGTEASLVMTTEEKNGRLYEKIKFINAPGGRGDQADLTETCNAAAALFGGAQATLPLTPAGQGGNNPDDDVPF